VDQVQVDIVQLQLCKRGRKGFFDGYSLTTAGFRGYEKPLTSNAGLLDSGAELFFITIGYRWSAKVGRLSAVRQ
jgi:hypothetical protein